MINCQPKPGFNSYGNHTTVAYDSSVIYEDMEVELTHVHTPNPSAERLLSHSRLGKAAREFPAGIPKLYSYSRDRGRSRWGRIPEDPNQHNELCIIYLLHNISTRTHALYICIKITLQYIHKHTVHLRLALKLIVFC